MNFLIKNIYAGYTKNLVNRIADTDPGELIRIGFSLSFKIQFQNYARIELFFRQVGSGLLFQRRFFPDPEPVFLRSDAGYCSSRAGSVSESTPSRSGSTLFGSATLFASVSEYLKPREKIPPPLQYQQIQLGFDPVRKFTKNKQIINKRREKGSPQTRLERRQLSIINWNLNFLERCISVALHY